MATSSDREPLLNDAANSENGGLRKRWVPNPENLPDDWDPTLPYGGKVYLARRKKPDKWWVTAVEMLLVVFVVLFSYYSYYYFDNLHFHVTHAYAKMGYPHAQHQVGQRYLHGAGVDQHHERAMEWFRKAADQGHAHASYNLAIGHLKGYKTDVKQGEAHHLIAHAASNGVEEAHKVLNEVCVKGGCDE